MGIIKAIKEFYFDFQKIPILLILALLLTFHATLILGDFSEAIEQIFNFFYKPENENIIDFIRSYTANIAILGLSYRCWIIVKKSLFYRNTNPEKLNDVKYNESRTRELLNITKPTVMTEYSIILLILMRYFLDILKYHQKNSEEFFDVVFAENSNYLIIGATIIIVSGVTAHVIDKFPAKKHFK
ncbi:MAG: hypothetical protein FWG45_05275 [Oscillospiraceae bacterium]|nr:hypothetical protein [Oscillospiraceae bacterium]